LKEFLGGRLFQSYEEAKDSVKQCKIGSAVVPLGEFKSGVLSEPLKRSMLLQVLRTSVQD
jgi:hypothetical protein